MSLESRKSHAPRRQTGELLKLQKHMQGIQHEMEFVEILAQFWPIPNMSHRMERLQQKLQIINQQYHQFSGLNADQAGSLPFTHQYAPAYTRCC